jgi:hypothetical protein
MKLLDIPVVFICPDHNEKYRTRRDHMFSLLKNTGFRNVTHFKSGTEAYPACLVNATIDILKSHLDDNPVLILEDDIELFKQFDMETEFKHPPDCDAFYLGFSMDGGSRTINLHDGPSIVQKVSDTHIRILNMLGGHAIVYISKTYKQQLISSLLSHTGYYNDVVMSRIQPDFKVYGYHYPLFYQSAIFGGAESRTKFEFTI